MTDTIPVGKFMVAWWQFKEEDCWRLYDKPGNDSVGFTYTDAVTGDICFEMTGPLGLSSAICRAIADFLDKLNEDTTP